jgi:hypothetical protein
MDAVTGLAGVLVGAALAGAIQLALTIRRERQAARVASRVLVGELRHAESVFKLVAREGAWLKPPPHLAGWTNHCAALAAILDADSWGRLDSVCQSITRYVAMREAQSPIAPEELLKQDGQLLGVMQKFARQGIAILEPVSETTLLKPPRPGSPEALRARLRHGNANSLQK